MVLGSLKGKLRRKIQEITKQLLLTVGRSRNRKAGEGSKIEITQKGDEERRQEKCLPFSREAGINHLFIDLIKT